MSVEVKAFIQDIVDDLDLKIESKEQEQGNYDAICQSDQYQFIAGEIEAYTSIQEAFCRILVGD